MISTVEPLYLLTPDLCRMESSGPFMSARVRWYLKKSFDLSTARERSSLVQDLTVELIGLATGSKVLIPAEHFDVIHRCDRGFREFSKHPSTFYSYRVDPFGFRSAFAAEVGPVAMAEYIVALNWGENTVTRNPRPWESAK